MRRARAISRGAVVLFATTATGACSALGPFVPAGPHARPNSESTSGSEGSSSSGRSRSSAKSSTLHLTEAVPSDEEARAIWKAALEAEGRRIVVSIQHRRLWLVEDADTVLSAPVAVGTGDIFVWDGEEYVFRTPRGRREILTKGTDPLWVPPDWHYFELAAQRGLELVHLKAGDRIVLSDSTIVTVRDGQVGRINRFGNFWPFTPGVEIIFDGKIFVPPFGTAQRKVPKVLGTHKLDLGDGYLIHGTNEEETIGQAVSHGCVRMFNEDVAELYGTVGVGTPVYIY